LRLLLVGALTLVPFAATAAGSLGIRPDQRTRVGTSDLVLNGAGALKKLFFKVYVAGLYLPEKRTSPAEVLALAGPKRVHITLLRNLPARELVAALNSGIQENCSPAEQEALRGRLAALTATLLSIGQARKGDVITFDWLPEAGCLVLLNGKPQGQPLPGADVYSALLRVWVGERPTSASLKRALLGQQD
jgi:hypothetical protein